MGFEDYSVYLRPTEASDFHSNSTIAALDKLTNALIQEWSSVSYDEEALNWVLYPRKDSEKYLCYKQEAYLFQIYLNVDYANLSAIGISLRFAYCNPRAVYKPFIAVIEWLMSRYQFKCHIMRDLSPDLPTGVLIESPKDLTTVIVPSADYNRRLWQLDVQNDEEAALRPEEAIERFVLNIA